MARETDMFLLFYNSFMQIIFLFAIGISISQTKVLQKEELKSLDRNAVELYEIIQTKVNK